MEDLPECARADALSAKAEDSGEPAHHRDAADAHGKAAKAAFKAGKPDLAKGHLKKAKRHKAAGVSPEKTPLAFAATRAKQGA